MELTAFCNLECLRRQQPVAAGGDVDEVAAWRQVADAADLTIECRPANVGVHGACSSHRSSFAGISSVSSPLQVRIRPCRARVTPT
jgi:hypothetical protein